MNCMQNPKEMVFTPDKQQIKCDVFQGGSDISNHSTNQSLCVRQDTKTFILRTFSVSFIESMSLIKIKFDC